MKQLASGLAFLAISAVGLSSFVVPYKADERSVDSLVSNASDSSKLPESPYRVVIDKSDYELKVYDEDGWVGTYPVVFGDPSLADKKMEGDKLTPEGVFHIVSKKIHKKWGPFLLLDYPNAASYAHFKDLKAQRKIPSKASIGGGIGIHGTRPNEEYAVDNFINWTDGCVSVKYSDIRELYDMLPVGTEVVIQK